MTSPVAVLTDSCASIPDHLAKQLNIEVVPYYIHRGAETLRDLAELSLALGVHTGPGTVGVGFFPLE